MMGMHNQYDDSSSAYSDGSAPGSGFAAAPAVQFSSISPASSLGDVQSIAYQSRIEKYLEVYDYVGGARFRGFVAGEGEQRAIFVFFDHDVIGCDLKAGLMALLELCDVPEFECSQLIVCLDRQLGTTETKTLNRDLGWVGFEPYTLADWTHEDDIISDRWVFLTMEV